MIRVEIELIKTNFTDEKIFHSHTLDRTGFQFFCSKAENPLWHHEDRENSPLNPPVIKITT